MKQVLRPPRSLLLLACCSLFLAAAWMYYSLFSTFMPYDDEGLFLRAKQMILAREAFYAQVNWPYGPSFLAVTQLLHGLLDIPLSTDWARWLALGGWLSLGLLVAGIILQQGKGGAWAIVAAVLVVLYLDAYAKEPGHPQGMITALALLMPLTLGSATGQQVPARWLWAGAIAAMVLQMKANTGVFAASAAVMVLASPWRMRRWPRFLSAALLVMSAAFPFVLMSPLLTQPGCLSFAVICALSLVTVTISLLHTNRAEPALGQNAGAFALGIVLFAVLLFLYSWMWGASPLDIVNSLLSYTESQAAFYHFFLPYSNTQLLSALLSLASLSLIVTGRAGSRTHAVLQAARSSFCALVIYALLIEDQANANALLGWAGPWCWVAVWPAGNRGGAAARQLLCALAVWFLMLAYPIPGSQLYFGSVMLLPLAVLCGAELLETARRQRFGRILATLMATGLTAVLGWYTLNARDHYQSRTPLALPGAERLRLGAGEVRRYRQLVAELNTADVALISSGFNSLYFWSTVRAPGQVLFSHSLRFLTPTQQAKMRQELLAARNPLVLIKTSRLSVSGPTEWEQWLEDHFQESRQIKPYLVMQKKDPDPL